MNKPIRKMIKDADHDQYQAIDRSKISEVRLISRLSHKLIDEKKKHIIESIHLGG